MISKMYSENHKTMSHGNDSCGLFKNGITNGAEWYEISGGMQDFNYLYSNCMEITLELSCVKKPLAKVLETEWENNKEAMLKFLEMGQGVLHGVVSDSNGEAVKDARIQVGNKNRDVFTTENGEYWRVLSPGSHSIRAMKGRKNNNQT